MSFYTTINIYFFVHASYALPSSSEIPSATLYLELLPVQPGDVPDAHYPVLDEAVVVVFHRRPHAAAVVMTAHDDVLHLNRGKHARARTTRKSVAFGWCVRSLPPSLRSKLQAHRKSASQAVLM